MREKRKTPLKLQPHHFYHIVVTFETTLFLTFRRRRKMQYYYYDDYCEKELRALGKSLECCVCIRLMESPARTRWYACDDDF